MLPGKLEIKSYPMIGILSRHDGTLLPTNSMGKMYGLTVLFCFVVNARRIRVHEHVEKNLNNIKRLL